MRNSASTINMCINGTMTMWEGEFINLYKSRLVQIFLVVLYAAVWFGILDGHDVLSPWIAALLLFCVLWANVRYVLLSTVIMVATAIPIWWFVIAPHQAGYTDILGWYPLIIINFMIFILLPEILFSGCEIFS